MTDLLRGIGADDESLLSHYIQQRSAAFHIGRNAGGNDEELARLGGIGIAEHRGGDVALAMRACSPARLAAAAVLIVLIER